jgi:hypothetical protein
LRFAQKGNKKCAEPVRFVPERWGWASVMLSTIPW